MIKKEVELASFERSVFTREPGDFVQYRMNRIEAFTLDLSQPFRQTI
jgi:hypothetical protein